MPKTDPKNSLIMSRPSFLDMWGGHINILCCPECIGEEADILYSVDGGSEHLQCARCAKKFEIIDGIPILLSGRSSGENGKNSSKSNYITPSRSSEADIDCSELEDWKYLSYQYYSRQKEFLKSVEDFEDGGVVIDIGCAGGSLAKHFKNYIGLDTSWKLISFARSYIDRPFVLADAGNMPFKTKSLSHFISRNMLEHTKEDGKIIREVARVCGGSGVFELPCSDGVSILIDPVNVIRTKLGMGPKYFFSYGFGHINMKTKAEWEEQLKKNGFFITSENSLGRGIIYKLNTLVEFILFSFGDNDDIPAKRLNRKYFKYIHPVYDVLYKLDPKTNKSWSKVFKVKPQSAEGNVPI